jgi:hypothetical protein
MKIILIRKLNVFSFYWSINLFNVSLYSETSSQMPSAREKINQKIQVYQSLTTKVYPEKVEKERKVSIFCFYAKQQIIILSLN